MRWIIPHGALFYLLARSVISSIYLMMCNSETDKAVSGKPSTKVSNFIPSMG